MTSPWPESWTIGARVVVRYRTGAIAPSGRPELTDVIGHVRSADQTSVVVERRDGRRIEVQRADFVTWKTVPETSPRSRP